MNRPVSSAPSRTSGRITTWRWSISFPPDRSRRCRWAPARTPNPVGPPMCRPSSGPRPHGRRRPSSASTMSASHVKWAGDWAIIWARSEVSVAAGAIAVGDGCPSICRYAAGAGRDSAHGIHPIAGQGLNLGFRDAIALSDLIIEANRAGGDVGSEALLARYQRLRRSDNLLMLMMTDRLDRLFSTDNRLLRRTRDIGIAAVDRSGPVKRMFMRRAMGLRQASALPP